MAITLPKLDNSNQFPSPELALEDPNGLLAFGGDLSSDRLIAAYNNGIFPWYSEGESLLWWSPDPRGILYLEDYHVSKSFLKFLRNTSLKVTLNHNFNDVIEACALIPRTDQGTWITVDMLNAYSRLHELNQAHSIEVWENDILVGGLYGVSVGGVFCGESMFHSTTNASKLAMYCLVNLMRASNGVFIDCQMQTGHLSSLGAKNIPRSLFLKELNQARKIKQPENTWKSKILFAKNELIGLI